MKNDQKKKKTRKKKKKKKKIEKEEEERKKKEEAEQRKAYKREYQLRIKKWRGDPAKGWDLSPAQQRERMKRLVAGLPKISPQRLVVQKAWPRRKPLGKGKGK